MFKKLIRLFDCIYHLGWKIGFKYWRVGNLAEKRPEIALEIAESLEKNSEEWGGQIAIKMAGEFRKSYQQYKTLEGSIQK